MGTLKLQSTNLKFEKPLPEFKQPFFCINKQLFMPLFNPSAEMPSGPKKRRAASKKKEARENSNSNHANNSQEINTNPDSTAAVVIFSSSSLSPADSSDNLPEEGVPVELNESVKLGMKENDTAAVVPASSVDLPDAAGDLPKDCSNIAKFCQNLDRSLTVKDMIADDITTVDYVSEDSVESLPDFELGLEEIDVKLDFAENIREEGINVEFNEDSNPGFMQNGSTILPSVDGQIPLTCAVALPTETDLNLTMENMVNLVPQNPDKSSKFPSAMEPSVEEDYEKVFPSPDVCGILSQNANQLERFKKTVIDELRATDKMRGFLEKVLNDLNYVHASK